MFCRSSAQTSHTTASVPVLIEGFLTFQGDAAVFGRSAGCWQRKWADMQAHKLSFWHFPEDVSCAAEVRMTEGHA